MPALPARRIATSALCAAFLAGITGPAALAADSSRERGTAAATGTSRPGADALLAQVRKLGHGAGPLDPVVRLMEAVLEADGNRLSRAEIEQLGQAAKDALTKAAADDQPLVTIIPPQPQTQATGVLLSTSGDELTSDEADDLNDAFDDLLELLLADGVSTNDVDDTDVVIVDVDEAGDDADDLLEDDELDDLLEDDELDDLLEDDELDDLLDDLLDDAEDVTDDAIDEADDLTDDVDDVLDDELASADAQLASADDESVAGDSLIDALLAKVDALVAAALAPGAQLPGLSIATATPTPTAAPTTVVTASTLPAPVPTPSIPVVTLPAS